MPKKSTTVTSHHPLDHKIWRTFLASIALFGTTLVVPGHAQFQIGSGTSSAGAFAGLPGGEADDHGVTSIGSVSPSQVVSATVAAAGRSSQASANFEALVSSPAFGIEGTAFASQNSSQDEEASASFGIGYAFIVDTETPVILSLL